MEMIMVDDPRRARIAMPPDQARVPRRSPQLWQWLIIGALISNVVEGAVRKWMLSGSGQLVYFITDLIVLGSYISFRNNEKVRTSIPEVGAVTRWLIVLASIVCFGIFNPALGSIIVGLFGAKCYLLDCLLIFTVPFLFNTKADLYRFFRYYLLLAIPVCLLGAAQFNAPANSVLNRYAAEAATISTFGEGGAGAVRITGTFAYITGHAVFLLVMALLSLGVMATERRLWARIVSVIVLGLVVVNLFMSGSRAFVLIVGLLVLISLVTFGLRRDSIGRRLRVLLVVGAVGGTSLVSVQFRRAYDAFFYRTTTTQYETFRGRVFAEADQMLPLANYVGIPGLGPGITQPGSWALRSAFSLPNPQVTVPFAEVEYARILVELGPIGLLIWYVLRVAVLVAIWKVYRKLRSPDLRFWAFLIFMLHLLTLDIGVVINHTFAVYYWFFAGVAFGLPRLEASQALDAQANASARKIAYPGPSPAFAR
jgi:hypothetical protein